MHRECIILLLLLHFVTLSSGISIYRSKIQNFTTEQVIEKWRKLDIKLKNMVSSSMANWFPTAIATSRDINLTPRCKKQIEYLLDGMRDFKQWALRFLDSSGKSLDGFMDGSIFAMGSYDECLDAESVSNKNNTEGDMTFQGQYCSLDFMPYLPNPKELKSLPELFKRANISFQFAMLPELEEYSEALPIFIFRMAICLPSGCTLEDADNMAKYQGDTYYVQGKAKRCETRESKKNQELRPAGTFSGCFLLFNLLLLVTGTVMSIISNCKKVSYTNIFQRILLCFSLPDNFQKLVELNTGNYLSCINGIRFIAMAWIILSHSYVLVDFHLLTGLLTALDLVKSFYFQPIVNGTFAVDTFFMIGGLVSCYVIVKNVKLGSHKFSVVMYIVHRLWRLLPLYMFVLLLGFTTRKLQLGPVYLDYVEQHVDPCYYYWWSHLLFINNFFQGIDRMCMAHTWYLACDFQLYIIALLILIPLIRSSMAGIVMGVLGIMASIISCMVVTYANDYPPGPIFLKSPIKISNYVMKYFDLPFVHLGPYCVGILAGYILAAKPKLQIPRVAQVTGWCLAFIAMFAVIFGVVEWNRGKVHEMAETLLYAGLARTSWAMGNAWVVICCATGYGGVINYILSMPIFTPLARLSFAAYLFSPLVQALFYGIYATHVPASHYFMIWTFFGHLFISFIFAFIGSMLIEAPFLALEKVFFQKRTEPSTEKPPDVTMEQNRHVKNVEQFVNEEILAKSFVENSNGVDKKEEISKL